MHLRASYHPKTRLASLLLALITVWGSAAVAVAAGTYGTNDYPNSGAASCSNQFGIYAWCVDANRDGAFQSSEQFSSRGFSYRNCTDFAAWRTGLTWSGINSRGDGNARAWRQGAIDRGHAHGPTPVIGAVAWWGASRGGGFGHVAIVTGVNSDGSANVEQYNASGTGVYSTQRNVRAEDYLYIGVPAPGTPNNSPSTQVAFQANTGSLWTAGSLGTGDLRLGMMRGTSPSLTLVNGGYQIAFQANTGSLWTTGPLGTRDLGLGMMNGTSPSITSVKNGAGYQIAFQANTGSLWTAGSLGTGDLKLGLMRTTSPSIAAVNNGTGYQIAFQANTGSLWTFGSLGSGDLKLGMMNGTSPSVAAVNNGAGYQIAFQANTGSLWTAGSLGTGDKRLGMMSGTSPG